MKNFHNKLLIISIFIFSISCDSKLETPELDAFEETKAIVLQQLTIPSTTEFCSFENAVITLTSPGLSNEL